MKIQRFLFLALLVVGWLVADLFVSQTATQAVNSCLTHEQLGQAVLTAVQNQQFSLVPDYGQNQGQPVQEMPSVDVAVIAFEEGCAPAYTNVLLSRDFPQGHIAQIDPQTLTVTGIEWKKDARNSNGNSYLWDKGANWDTYNLEDLLPGLTGQRYVVPYPASLLKLMTAVKIMQLVDQGQLQLNDPYTDANNVTKSVQTWMDEMITISSNSATFAMIKLLHDRGEIIATVPPNQANRPCPQQTQRTEIVNTTNDLFASLGLNTLQMSRTRACDGSFFNDAGSGVGWHHMTAWDTARLLWLLDTAAPPPDWAVNGTPVNANFIGAASKNILVNQFLGQQGFHEVLSTTATCGLPGRLPGIPADLPDRWIAPDGSVTIDGIPLSPDARPCDAVAEVMFAHKTGLTSNYGSNAGIVTGAGSSTRHYIISFVSNLGSRYTNTCETVGICYTQKIPSLGATIDSYLEIELENGSVTTTPTATITPTPTATRRPPRVTATPTSALTTTPPTATRTPRPPRPTSTPVP